MSAGPLLKLMGTMLVMGVLACPALAQGQAQYVIVISVDGMGSAYVRPLLASGVTNELKTFERFQNEGVGTLNARNDYDYAITLPNHVTMMTSRGVVGAPGHNWTLNSDPLPTDSIGSNKGSYVASGFDVAHDNGLRTGLWSGKSKFVIFTQSYNSTNGAPDTTGIDNGRNKIDYSMITGGVAAAVLTTDFTNRMAANPFNFVFFHYQDPDIAGHSYGWSTNPASLYAATLKSVDTQIGNIMRLAESNATLKGKTAIILTADHGGHGYTHGDTTNPLDYTIPFYVWGPSMATGSDVYAINTTSRTEPGSTQNPPYTGSQPVRNGDAGNLAVNLLGLGPIPGSSLNFQHDLLVADSASRKVLTVISAQGGAYPGTTTRNPWTVLSCLLTNSPLVNGTTQYVASGGSVAGNSCSQNSLTNISLVLTNDTTLTWNWTTQFMLNVTSAGNGSVGGETNGWKDIGSNISVTATASNYYHFASWSGSTNGSTINGGQLGAPMTGPRQILAQFAANLATNNTPHWWLAQYGLATNDTGAMYDDGDGMPAWQEYVADTDPTNRSSVLALTAVTISGAGARMAWTGGSLATQYLEVRNSLTSTSVQWTAIATNLPPTPTATNYLDSANTNPVEFYRIRVTR